MRAYRMTRAELVRLAADVAVGRVFFADDPEQLQLCFPVVLLAMDGATRDSDLETIGHVYEYLDRAAEHAVNGLPMFLSARFLHVNDVGRLVGELEAQREWMAERMAAVR